MMGISYETSSLMDTSQAQSPNIEGIFEKRSNVELRIARTTFLPHSIPKLK
jgi:hypothetical protein